MLSRRRRRSSASLRASDTTTDMASRCLSTARDAASLTTVRSPPDFLKVALFQAMIVFHFEQFSHYQIEEFLHGIFDLRDRDLQPSIGGQLCVAADLNSKARPVLRIQYRNAQLPCEF